MCSGKVEVVVVRSEGVVVGVVDGVVGIVDKGDSE